MMTLGDSPVRVALLGCGVVGSQVARILIEQADDLRARVGRPLELVGIGVVIEKSFESGRELLTPLGVPIEALAIDLSSSPAMWPPLPLPPEA